MPDNLIEVNEHIVPEKLIDLVLPNIMANAQPPNRAYFVRGVVVDVHTGILFPPVENPVHEALKCEFLLIMRIVLA